MTHKNDHPVVVDGRHGEDGVHPGHLIGEVEERRRGDQRHDQQLAEEEQEVGDLVHHEDPDDVPQEQEERLLGRRAEIFTVHSNLKEEYCNEMEHHRNIYRTQQSGEEYCNITGLVNIYQGCQ